MKNWLCDNFSTLLVGLALAALVLSIITKLIRDKRAGKHSCSCVCGGCSIERECHTRASKQ